MNATHTLSLAETAGLSFIPSVILIIVGALIRILQLYIKRKKNGSA